MKLTNDIQQVLIKIYNHQVLSSQQVLELLNQDIPLVEALIKEDYLFPCPCGVSEMALALEPKALQLVYELLNVPKEDRRRASRQRPEENLVKRQLNLNEFVFKLIKRLEKERTHYRYYDGKRLPDGINHKPHGLFQLNDLDIYLYSLDKEFVQQHNLKTFKKTFIPEANEGQHERPRLILYLTAHESMNPVIEDMFDEMIQTLNKEGLSFYCLTYDSEAEMETLMNEFIYRSKNPFYPIQCAVQTLRLYEQLNLYSFETHQYHGAYDRILNQDGQFYLFVDYRFPFRTEAKITIRCHRENLKHPQLKTLFEQDNLAIPLIVLLPDETSETFLFEYLETNLNRIHWNDPLIYFTTPSELIKHKNLSEAIFRINSFGQKQYLN